MIDTLSYLACLIDAEGCITISNGRKRHYQLIVRIGMYDKEPLELMASAFGGSVDPTNRKDKKPCWCYTATSDRALSIMVELVPYLLVKRGEAEIAIIFQSGMTSYKGGRRTVPQDEIDFRDLCYQKMQEAIKRHKVRQ